MFLQIIINGRAIHVFDEHDVSKIPWELAGVNYVVEATDALNNLNDAKLHLRSKQVDIHFFIGYLHLDFNYVHSANERTSNHESFLVVLSPGLCKKRLCDPGYQSEVT